MTKYLKLGARLKFLLPSTYAEDGSPLLLSDIQSINIYYGTVSGNLGNLASFTTAGGTLLITPTTPPETWYVSADVFVTGAGGVTMQSPLAAESSVVVNAATTFVVSFI